MKKLLFLLLLGSVLLTSCSKKFALTTEVRQGLELNDKDLYRIQFYISDDIVLYKIQSDGTVGLSEGKVIFKSNKSSDKVLIKKGTKCVIEKVLNDNSVLIAFENGESRVLPFGSPSPNGFYRLMAKDWKNKLGSIDYAGTNYVADEKSGTAFLVFKMKKYTKAKSRERVLKGRKLN